MAERSEVGGGVRSQASELETPLGGFAATPPNARSARWGEKQNATHCSLGGEAEPRPFCVQDQTASLTDLTTPAHQRGPAT